MKIKNKKSVFAWGILFLGLAVLNLILGFMRGFDYPVVIQVSVMLLLGLDGIINSMSDDADNEEDEKRKINSSIIFKADSVTIQATKMLLLIFFGGVYLLRGTTWMTETLITYGMFSMIVFNIVNVMNFIAKLYYINKREKERI